jgi:hypothetical protein
MASRTLQERIIRLMNADFRGRSTCLFPTQSRPMLSRFSLVFSGFEHGELGVV